MARWTKEDIDRLNAKREGQKPNDNGMVLTENQIWIPGHVPSLKNGKSAFVVGKGFKGKPQAVLVHSKPVQDYARNVLPHLIELRPRWDEIMKRYTTKQVVLLYQFHRKTAQYRQKDSKDGLHKKGELFRHHQQPFDFTGCHDTLNDCLSGSIYKLQRKSKKLEYVSKVGKDHPRLRDCMWIADDDCNHLASIPDPTPVWNDENPGTLVTVVPLLHYSKFVKSCYEF